MCQPLSRELSGLLSSLKVLQTGKSHYPKASLFMNQTLGSYLLVSRTVHPL